MLASAAATKGTATDHASFNILKPKYLYLCFSNISPNGKSEASSKNHEIPRVELHVEPFEILSSHIEIFRAAKLN